MKTWPPDWSRMSVPQFIIALTKDRACLWPIVRCARSATTQPYYMACVTLASTGLSTSLNPHRSTPSTWCTLILCVKMFAEIEWVVWDRLSQSFIDVIFSLTCDYTDLVNNPSISHFKHDPCQPIAEYYLVIFCRQNCGEFLILSNYLLFYL